jgi:hypothetical protein
MAVSNLDSLRHFSAAGRAELYFDPAQQGKITDVGSDSFPFFFGSPIFAGANLS